MRYLQSLRVGCAVLAASLSGNLCHAAPWFPLGPYGGDARSLAADPSDPKHLFLGTATGWIYDSHDGGTHWTRVAQVANRNDLAIDHIVVDKTNPKRLVVGAFIVDHPADGGLFISEDYGKNWYSQAEMRGQSVRALARSDSNPKELVAGTLKGVFRSLDNGVHWQQISPVGSTEIHEVQSIAIDPKNPDVLYAGTWHLPWKTTDGGATWHNIKEGIIDDSDVFSIIVDPKNPKTVYASACSGIYKSSDAGEMFRKVQGIPSAARRTRTLEQDPEHLEIVYAGTTEGLYRTLDAGVQWERLTPVDTIVNDVYVDPTNANHVLLATDRGGVYRSEDGGSTFESSNDGFSTRQITAFAMDAQHPDNLFVGVVNGKATGGVFQSNDGAVHWQQTSEGLGGRDIFSLVSLQDGTLLAGTEHGIYRLDGGSWKESSLLEGAPVPQKAALVSKPHPQPAASLLRVSAPAHKTGTPAPPRAHIAKHGQRLIAKLPAGTSQHGTRLVRTKVRLASSRVGTRDSTLTHTHASLTQSAAQHARLHAGTLPPHAAAETPGKSKIAGPGKIDGEVYSLQRSRDVLFATSAAGLLRSNDSGQHWGVVGSLTIPDLRFLSLSPATVSSLSSETAAAAPPPTSTSQPADPGGAASSASNGAQVEAAEGLMLAANLSHARVSTDAGVTWQTLPLPQGLTQIGAVCIDGGRNLWIGGREGVWYSSDSGANWKTLRNLFLTEVDSIYYDSAGQRVLVTGASSSAAFSVQLPGDKVTYWDTGWKLRFVRPVGDRLVGATLFDGMVVQPQMVDSPVATTASSH